MYRTLLVLTFFVISLHTIRSNCSGDDEFAEFDDIVSDDFKQDVPILSAESSQQSKPAKERTSSNEAQVILEHSDSKDAGQESEEVKDSVQNKPELKLVNAPAPKIYNGKNSTFAQQWYQQTRELLKQQFALVGGSPQINEGGQKRDEDGESNVSMTKKQRGLIKSAESLYTLWNSGRVGVEGLLVEINLLKRQDLFSMALNLLKPSKDNLVLHFLLSQEGYENFVFCLAHKTQAVKLVRDMVDINTFCPKRKPISQFGLDFDKLFVMSELSDVTSFILDHTTTSFLKKYEQSINYIHITDQYSTLRSEEVLPAQKLANSKRMATFSFVFPQNSTDRSEFIMFSLNLLDRLRRFKLARDSKQKSEKNRQKITDIIQKTAFSQRQEAAQTKKEELRRMEKERIYNEDDPIKQKKWEKKEAKRELKKNKMRVKQLKVKSM